MHTSGVPSLKPLAPLSLAAAVAAASSGSASAQVMATAAAGDMAIVPYYTVQNNYATGLSIANNSDNTQVVKVRLRRATDAMGALDFNVLLSARDVWSGVLQSSAEIGALTGLPVIKIFTGDTSCTVPENSGSLSMPEIYRVGAEEGYIEIIGMGQPSDEQQPIALAAAPAGNGVPVDCTRASDNFRRGTGSQDYFQDWPAFEASTTYLYYRTRGVINSALTAQYSSVGGAVNPNDPVTSTYVDTDNVLTVSYFIRSDETGVEFGNNAVHVRDFMDGASITNQTVGIFEGDLQGFDYPDLNGPAPSSLGGVIDNIASVPSGAATARSSYEALRNELSQGYTVNDWSANDQGAFSVDTDWVLTAPGQYLMVNLFGYLTSLADPGFPCLPGTPGFDNLTLDGENCDFRDVPMRLSATVQDRRDNVLLPEEDDLVISPQPPGSVQQQVLAQDVNVLTWGTPVLGSARTIGIPRPADSRAGWASVSVQSSVVKIQATCDFVRQRGTSAQDLEVNCVSTSAPAPVIGFAAWQRNFTDMPAVNYGRIVNHSRAVNSAVVP